MSQTKVRVRFAPSPTGYLHVGGARTALYNYLYAKKHGGKFIVRVEDTDEARSTDESLRMMIHDLEWLDLKWDEGPNPRDLSDVGPHGPYRQSRRKDIYKDIADQILKKGLAYYCFMTDEEIDAQRQEALAAGKQPHVNSPYQDWSLEKALAKKAEGGKAVVRFRTKHLTKDYVFKDIVRGEITFPADMVGDFVLLRSDGMPVYNFCCVVDDYMMEISHVLRAEEHLPNTLRQLMIYESMGWTTPEFGHLSVVLDEDRQKMSKRKGATSCFQFKEEGYLPEALKNFILLLGWSHPEEKEILTMDEMISSFTSEKFHSAGAIFDGVKLKWMNSVYLRALSDTELWRQIEPFLKKNNIETPVDPDWRAHSLAAFKSYMEVLTDAVPLYKHIDDKFFEIKEQSADTLSWDPTKAVIQAWRNGLAEKNPESLMSEKEFLDLQDQVKNETGAKGKNLFMPVRVAVIGVPQGTELKQLVPLLKVKSLLLRADKTLAKLG